MSEVEPGRVLQGRYRVEAKLGEGGMAVVYRAYDQRRHVPVALKALKADYAEDAEFVGKFGREARNLAALQHPHIVRFYEFIEDGLTAVIVLDYIEGSTLRARWRAAGRPLSPAEVLAYLRPICAALSYAHSQGVVHCDLKPANVMLDRAGRVFLTDFGIARLSEGATITFSTPGTPPYMAPEQWRADDVTPATDVYALGVLLYELLTSRQPFTGESIQTRGHTREKIMREHLAYTPPPPSGVNPALPAAMDTVVLRCLEKHPADRYASAADLLAAYERAMPAEASDPGPTALLPAPLAPASPPVRRVRPAVAVTTVLVVSAALVTSVVALAAGRGREGAATATPPAATAVATSLPTLAIASSTPRPSPAAATPTPPPASETPALSGLQSPVDGMALVEVPAGDFVMGSNSGHPASRADELPWHTVYLDQFWIDQTEVTNAQYAAFLDSQGNRTEAGVSWLAASSTLVLSAAGGWQAPPGLEHHPVVGVSWYGAAAYCQWAGRRLPSEAEWEKAARGTDQRQFPWGNDLPNEARANYQTASQADGYTQTAPVGSFPDGASPFGALDMAGNVWEWVADWYAEDYFGVSARENPLGPTTGQAKLLRGGSWNGDESMLRTARRGGPVPIDTSNFDFGFRCATTSPPDSVTRAVWDISHGPRIGSAGAYTPAELYSQLADRLAENDILISSGSLAEVSKYDLLILSATSAQDQSYSTAEAELIRRQVEQGGSLMLLGERFDFPNHIQEVASQFGIALGGRLIQSAAFSSPQPLGGNLKDLSFLDGGALTPGPNCIAIASDENAVAAISCEIGLGRVVVVGDSNIWDNRKLEQADNAEFAVAAFLWLARRSPTPAQP